MKADLIVKRNCPVYIEDFELMEHQMLKSIYLNINTFFSIPLVYSISLAFIKNVIRKRERMHTRVSETNI